VTGTWAVTPTDVPGLRREQVAYNRSPDALSWNLMWAITGKGVRLEGINNPEVAAKIATENELHRLTHADLYYVAPEMVDLVQAAYATMPEFAPQRSDLPSEFGLIVFGKPLADRPLVGSEIELYRRLEQRAPVDTDARTPVIAAAWGPYNGGPGREGLWGRYGGGLFINFYTARDVAMRAMMASEHGEDARRMLPPLINENEASFALYPGDGMPTPFGLTEEDYKVREREPNDFSGEGQEGFVGPWTRMLLATFTLMRQPGLAQQRPERPPRHERRRDAREGIAEKDVQIVYLRRLHQPSDSDDQAPAESAEGREWHHQWIVRGHWRNQAYGAGRALRRPKWIAPYTKGPDDKPLKGGEKVNVWNR
jgi:hypothetical protein